MSRGTFPGRGAVLLEVVVSLALFVSAGVTILVYTGQSLDGLERARLTQQACELARSAMSRLEAGLDTPRTLNGPARFTDGSLAPIGRWEIEVETEPSAIRGLTAITVTASRLEEGRSEAVRASYTLRQLVRLGARAPDTPGDDDPLSGMGAVAGLPPGPALASGRSGARP